MQINSNMFDTMTDWVSGGEPDSNNETDFMQTLNSALDPNNENAAQLVSMLSGQDDTASAMKGSDAMFAALTQNMMQSMVQAALAPTPEQVAATAAEAADPAATAFADGSSPGLGDALDIINPLQHIPLVSQYYRDWTGDDMGYISQVAGGALWGGSLGVAASFVNLGLTSVMGKSPTQYMQQFFAADEAATANPDNVAATAPSPKPKPAPALRPASS